MIKSLWLEENTSSTTGRSQSPSWMPGPFWLHSCTQGLHQLPGKPLLLSLPILTTSHIHQEESGWNGGYRASWDVICSMIMPMWILISLWNKKITSFRKMYFSNMSTMFLSLPSAQWDMEWHKLDLSLARSFFGLVLNYQSLKGSPCKTIHQHHFAQ